MQTAAGKTRAHLCRDKDTGENQVRGYQTWTGYSTYGLQPRQAQHKHALSPDAMTLYELRSDALSLDELNPDELDPDEQVQVTGV